MGFRSQPHFAQMPPCGPLLAEWIGYVAGLPTRFADQIVRPIQVCVHTIWTVNGKPLWYLTIGEIDHPFRTALAAAFPPYENAGCHTAETERHHAAWSMSAGFCLAQNAHVLGRRLGLVIVSSTLFKFC